MKMITAAFGILLAASVRGQKDTGTIFKKITGQGKQLSSSVTLHVYTPPGSTRSADTARFITTLSNSVRVYSLPQDNMPCVVPPKSIYVIPNRISGAILVPQEHPGLPGKIPNPAKPIVIPFIEKNKNN